MIEEKDKKLKEYFIFYYEDLLIKAVEKEDYETAAKYKKWIDNLKKNNN